MSLQYESAARGLFFFIYSFDMLTQKKADTLLSMTVTEGITVNVLPNRQHEFLMTTREVAAGYGVSEWLIRKHKENHPDELLEGKHFLGNVNIIHAATPGSSRGTLWTKRGIVRLGFFIRSERARLFRDWAEDLVLAVVDKPAAQPVPSGRRINRLTPERVIDLLSDVCRIEDKELRERIVNKITGGLDYGTRR